MLGRFKHEGANVTLAADGRAVAYMGDDERNDYIYKFVSSTKMDRAPHPAGQAAQHVAARPRARCTSRASPTRPTTPPPSTTAPGRWIPLCSDTESFVDGMSVADVLIDTRLAADTVAPTRMDRPEDIEVNPVNGKVYCALTNNSTRGTTYPTDEANPVGTSKVRAAPGAPLTDASGNRNGYVLEMTPRRGDHASDRFAGP